MNETKDPDMLTRSLTLSVLLFLGLPLLELPPAEGNDPIWSVGLTAQEASPDSDYLAGLQAREIGPAVMSGRIVDLAVVEMDPTVFYVASSIAAS